MKRMTEYQDAFGHALLDALEGRPAEDIVERDDGYIALSAPAANYLQPPAGPERKALDNLKGRVLDIGCGAGRVALYLQKAGCDVVAMDISPLAVDVCMTRGVRDARVLDIRDIDVKDIGEFDGFAMMGNNFGLLGTHSRARRLLRRFYRMSSDSAIIVAQTLDPYKTDEVFHIAYHEQNRARGRMGGQVRLRSRYKNYKTPWFDYLFVSQSEMAETVAETGWKIREIFASDSAVYTALLENHR
jgi:SAM-dependent methyltransferase